MLVFIKKGIWLFLFAVLTLSVLIAVNTIIQGDEKIIGELIFLIVVSPISIVTLAITRNKLNSY